MILLLLIVFTILISIITLYNCFVIRFLLMSFKMVKQMKAVSNILMKRKQKDKKYNKGSDAYQ